MLGLNLITSAMSPLGDALTISTLRRHGAFDHRYGRIRMFGSAGFIAAVLLGGALFERVGIDAFPWLASATLALFTLVVAGMRDAGGGAAHAAAAGHAAAAACRRGPVPGRILPDDVPRTQRSTCSIRCTERLGYSKFAIGVMWTIGVVAEIAFFFYRGRLFARCRCARSSPGPSCWRRCVSA